jgi:hypothetical protein
MSASKRKIVGYFGAKLSDNSRPGDNSIKEITSDDVGSYRLVDPACITRLIQVSNLICPLCKIEPSCIVIREHKKLGLSSLWSLYCTDCKVDIPGPKRGPGKCFTSTRLGDADASNVAFDVNIRTALATKEASMGFSAFEHFAATVNMPPPMHVKTFQGYQPRLLLAAEGATDVTLDRAVDIVKQLYVEVLGLGPRRGIPYSDIDVSFDGTWMTRGRRMASHIGAGFIIELYTGLIVDYVVLSNYCKACAIGPDKDRRVWCMVEKT